GFRLRAEDARDDMDRLSAEAEDDFGQHPCSLAGANSPACDDIEKANDRLDTSSRVGNIALIVGGVAAAATATFAVINLWPSSEAPRASLSVGPTGYNLKGTFYHVFPPIPALRLYPRSNCHHPSADPHRRLHRRRRYLRRTRPRPRLRRTRRRHRRYRRRRWRQRFWGVHRGHRRNRRYGRNRWQPSS